MFGTFILVLLVFEVVFIAYLRRMYGKRKEFCMYHPSTGADIPQFVEVKDSGKREVFDTGSVRDTEENKGRYDLLPWYAIDRLAKHYQNGAAKYGDNNWRKGINLSRYLSSAMRHLVKYAMGWRDEDHLAAALWNIAAIIETEKMIADGLLPSELNDLPHFYKTEGPMES